MSEVTREEVLLLLMALEDGCASSGNVLARHRGVPRRKLAEEVRELVGREEWSLTE